MSDAGKLQQADEEVRKNLPNGIKLVRTLRGHTGIIGDIAWSPDGRMLATPSSDKTIRLWDAETGKCLFTLEGHIGEVNCVAFDPKGHILASGSDDNTIKLWELASGKLLFTLKGHKKSIRSLVFRSQKELISGSIDGTIKFWNINEGYLQKTLLYGTEDSLPEILALSLNSRRKILVGGGNSGVLKLWSLSSGPTLEYTKFSKGFIKTIAFSPGGRNVVFGGSDSQIFLFDVVKYIITRTLEFHTGYITSVGFSSDEKIIAAKSQDDSVSLWKSDTGTLLASFSIKSTKKLMGNLAFHPHLPMIAIVNSDPNAEIRDYGCIVSIFEYNLGVLLQKANIPTITYTSAKIVLVGDSGVGKSGLGWRLAHGEFKEHSSTHGQQFWLLNQLCKQRQDGAQCEAVLWDLAGQRDYRLIHALFLDDVDLALVLFDPTHDEDPLRGVEFWLKQLMVKAQPLSGTPSILIAARTDRGSPRMTEEELNAFCKYRGIKSYLLTSAKSGAGIEELIHYMQSIIPWDEKPATVTTETFKRIKDLVLELKENNRRHKVILTPKELRHLLEMKGRNWKFSDAEMMTAVEHLENHGYVTQLMTSKGETRILLVPELLNNLAASFVLEARNNQEGLGSLEEQLLLLGEYKFPELEKLNEAEKDILLDSVAVLFLEHNICFRETNPLNNRAYLVFPELINMKKPLIEDDIQIEDGVAYTVSGAIENVYASLVVLMGYTQTFTRTNHWQNHARYEMGKGFVCGFRLEEERAGELDLVLYFGTNTPILVRSLFQSLFENFLARRNLTVRRFEPVLCTEKHTLNRSVVRELMSSGSEFAFCNRCGEKIKLPKVNQPIHLTKQQVEEVEANRLAADQRSRFEQVLFRLKSYIMDKGTSSLECFISYAWGNSEQELWVERSLATDLQKAGIKIVLDRWENARIGVSVPRFVERIGKTDKVIVVGTPLYRRKYDNEEPMRSFVLAAEGDLIGNRMIGPEKEKESILPILFEGTKKSSFPLLLQSRVYADFRDNKAYFEEMFKLILSIYQIKKTDPVAIELNESLAGKKNIAFSQVIE